MTFGQITIIVAFVTSLASSYFAWRSAKTPPARKGETKAAPERLFRRSYSLMSLAVGVASAILLYGLLTHDFRYSYVAHYSSLEQPLLYLFSAFWAGQEGTFLLWALLVTVMGWVFMSRPGHHDGYTMMTVSGMAAFLYLLLIVKSPFELLATIPPNGSGMNPLLQDPWMAIHPPILFIGYAATIFPFGLAISALLRRNYDNWSLKGFSWTLFAALTLGAGIIIGAFWAYEVLGWGGYWGWDPVENSSLVPWLVLLVLIHGLVIEKSKGSLRRTNLFLAILVFLLVVYATFLTRSGVLADFSVHSFTDLGINNYLIGFMTLTVVVGLGLFLTRFRGLKSPKVDLSSLNRELALLLSMYVVGAAALFTFVGMSSPIITGIIGKASQVDPAFYNKVNLPVAIGMALLLGVTPFLGWVEEKKGGMIKRYSMPLALTALSAVIAYVAGVEAWPLLLFVSASAFGLISNVIIAFRQYRSGWWNLGGPIAHIGVALALIGIVGSGKFDETTKLVLKTGIPQQAFGFAFTFQGITDTPGEKTQMNISVADGRGSFVATPKLYYSEYNQSIMREPNIKVLPLKDVYISPLELHSTASQHANPTLDLSKGQAKDIGGYHIEFVRFETGQHGESGGMAVGAVLGVTVQGQTHEVIPQMVINERGQREMIPAMLPALVNPSKGAQRPQVTFAGMNVESKSVVLELLGFEEHQSVGDSYELLVDVSTKPLMMVLWTGVVLIVGGTAMALKRRSGSQTA